MKTLRVRITFTEPTLGMAPSNKDIYRDFIASKTSDAMKREEEIEAIGAEEYIDKKGKTIFPKMEDGTPFFWDYQIKGFFKDACGGLREANHTISKDLKAYKKKIDKLIFPMPRRIPIHFEGEIGECQRPLRGQTPQGERITVACSEKIPAGAWIEFSVDCLKDDLCDVVREWLDNGTYFGISQWRSAGWGRFVWDELDEDGNVIDGNRIAYEAANEAGK